ncbi:MAG: hypothetical protein ACTHMY_02300 [Solirubrobacteraceae bacterium]
MTTAPPDPAADGAAPLADPVAETRRVIDAAREQSVTLRAMGGVAVYLLSPGHQPILPRPLKDIDLVTSRGQGSAAGRVLAQLEYVGAEMFNALRGSRRQLFHDPVNQRDVDVFVGEFTMCHTVPIAERLDRLPYTVPVAELLLTKLQIVELNERDERDIYTLCYHHELTDDPSSGLDAALIAGLCADDWGLWRTSKGTIERCIADLDRYGLDAPTCDQILSRLSELWDRIEAEPKTSRWRRRSRLGERKRWYQEPEEV